jgi:LPS-assembly lipoprotein
MSLRKTVKRSSGLLAVLGLGVALGVTAGCTVRPLYATSHTAPGEAPKGVAAALRTVSVAPVATRDAQEVRNQLIFLFNGGKAQAATPAYTVNLAVLTTSESSADIQVADDTEPTAAAIVMDATYSITDAATGAVVANGKRSMSSSYDVPRQEFAVLRAQRDAENRAARELAELLRLAIAQDILNIQSVPKALK